MRVVRLGWAGAVCLLLVALGGGAAQGQVARGAGVPRTYTAEGPVAAQDLARLRAALARLPGVSAVEARVEFGAVTVVISADGQATQSLFAAAARSAGYLMRPVQAVTYAAVGSTAPTAVAGLRAALERVPGVDEVEVGPHPQGAAVRLLGVTAPTAVPAAGKAAGYALRQVTAYVVSGPTERADVARLRTALSRVPGVEQLEIQTLIGGATLLAHGAAREAALVTAARDAGFVLWPLGNATRERLFAVAGKPTSADLERLRGALAAVVDIGGVETRTGPEGARVAVGGGRARPDAIQAAAQAAGFTLTALPQPVTLPTLTPEPDRNTPPDYDQRVIGEAAVSGGPAPAFDLLSGDGTSRVTLARALAAGKPLVLVFGSCTCPPFRAACPSIERLYQTYRDRVNFLLVYIVEAHPGSILSLPTADGGRELRIIPPTDTEPERLENLERFRRIVGLTMPAVVDTADSAMNRSYGAFPIRLYVITPDGKIAYKGAPGPSGFRVPELADWLRANVK